MNIKQMAEDIRTQMPKGLDELETLRDIYIYLGKHKIFDQSYYFGNNKTKKKIYTLATKNLYNEKFLTEKKDLICISIASTLRLLSKNFNIDLRLEQEEEGIGAHMCNIAELKDGRRIKMDLQQDLSLIQTGRRTKHFATSDWLCDAIDDKKIEEIDEKIGYKKIGKNYRDDELRIIENKVKKMDKLEAIDCILNDEVFLEGLKEADGYIEALVYVKEILNDCIGVMQAYVINCYRDEDINKQPLPKRQYSICVYATDIEQSNIYLFKKKDGIFEKVDQKRMKRLMDQGLKVEEKSKLLLREINKNVRLQEYEIE